MSTSPISNRFTKTVGLSLALACFAILGNPRSAQAAGADVIYSNLADVVSHGLVGGVRAYSLGTGTCNIGTANHEWESNGSPSVGFNAYRLYDDRLMQIGMSWVKTACCVGNSNGCGMTCTSVGVGLRVGCRDTYGASWNAIQDRMMMRSRVNPVTGVHGAITTGSYTAVSRRLQVAEGDLSTTSFPDALYFIEGQYVGRSDAQAGNAMNNASYQRATFNGGSLAAADAFQQQIPAIYAWRAYGNGLGQPVDTSVNIVNIDVPSDGRFIAATRVRDNRDGTWRYDYAVMNFNSDRCGGSFTIPVPENAQITGIGFHDVDYHSGEIFDNTDWVVNQTGTEISWSSPQTHAQNPNTNALRWGTMYNFWFTANRGPGDVQAKIDLFRPGTPDSVSYTAEGPVHLCAEDVVGNDAEVNIDDLVAVIMAWGWCQHGQACPADITGNHLVDIDDLAAVITSWGPCK